MTDDANLRVQHVVVYPSGEVVVVKASDLLRIWGLPPPVPTEAEDERLYGKAVRDDKGEPIKPPAEARAPSSPSDDAELIRRRMRELGLDKDRPVKFASGGVLPPGSWGLVGERTGETIVPNKPVHGKIEPGDCL